MNLAFLALLPAALLIDRLFGELPSRVHPVCMMGALASRMEALFRRGSNNALMSLSGTLACLLVVLPCAALAGGLAWAAQVYADPRAAWFVSAIIIWICVAPRSLEEHALRVAVPLAKGDLEGARKAVSMMVGRNPDRLDAHGVARACVESVGENLTDGVLSTLFWAGIGLFFFGYPGAACLAVLHRSANMLDALWGKKNKKYIRFGTFAARLDDALNFVPARLSLPFIAFASRIIPNLRHRHLARGLEIPRGPRKPQFRMERGGLCRGPRPQARRPRRVRGSARRSSVARRRNPRRQTRAHRAGGTAHVAFRHRLHTV